MMTQHSDHFNTDALDPHRHVYMWPIYLTGIASLQTRQDVHVRCREGRGAGT